MSRVFFGFFAAGQNAAHFVFLFKHSTSCDGLILAYAVAYVKSFLAFCKIFLQLCVLYFFGCVLLYIIVCTAIYYCVGRLCVAAKHRLDSCCI